LQAGTKKSSDFIDFSKQYNHVVTSKKHLRSKPRSNKCKNIPEITQNSLPKKYCKSSVVDGIRAYRGNYKHRDGCKKSKKGKKFLSQISTSGKVKSVTASKSVTAKKWKKLKTGKNIELKIKNLIIGNTIVHRKEKEKEKLLHVNQQDVTSWLSRKNGNGAVTLDTLQHLNCDDVGAHRGLLVAESDIGSGAVDKFGAVTLGTLQHGCNAVGSHCGVFSAVSDIGSGAVEKVGAVTLDTLQHDCDVVGSHRGIVSTGSGAGGGPVATSGNIIPSRSVSQTLRYKFFKHNLVHRHNPAPPVAGPDLVVDHRHNEMETMDRMLKGETVPYTLTPPTINKYEEHILNLNKQFQTVPPMLRSVRVRLEKLCTTFARDDGSTPIADLVNMLPHVQSWRYAEVVRMAEMAMYKVHPEERLHPPDFDPVSLFNFMEGSNAIESAAARHVFEQLTVGGGRFPSLYNGTRDTQVDAKNGRKLVLPASVDPYKVQVPRSDKSQKRRHFDLAAAEVESKRYLGPFTPAEAAAVLEHYITVQSFVLFKSGAISTKDRMVTNFSDPKHPVNMMLDNDLMWSVELDHTSKFISYLRQWASGGKPLHMVTADISKGYRRLFTRVQDVKTLGLRVDIDFEGTVPFFDGKSLATKQVNKGDLLYMFDRSLPFGLTSSVSSFCAVTSMIRDITRERLVGICEVCVYVDDFVLIGSPQHVQTGIMLLRKILALSGLPENALKMETPGATGTYLGVDYDLRDPLAITATLPAKKKDRYIKHLEYYISKASVDDELVLTRTELQSIVGKLAHAAFIFQAGKPFYQRLLAKLRGGKSKKSAKITLDSGCLDDCRWWVKVLSEHSGSVLLNPAQREVRVYTDASTTTGYGVCYQGRYFRGEWSKEIKDLLVDFSLTINELELVALNFALDTFGHELHGCKLHFRCDNLACVYNIHSMSSQRPVRAALLRRLFAIAAHYGVDLCSTYIPTDKNLHADFLSRGKMKQFFSLPQHYPLQEVEHPVLQAMDLLVHPMGLQNPSSPTWFNSHLKQKRVHLNR